MTQWHEVRPEDRDRIECERCPGRAEVCEHAGNPHPFFYYCLACARNVVTDRAYSRTRGIFDVAYAAAQAARAEFDCAFEHRKAGRFQCE